MNPVQRMSGRGCAYFQQGRCTATNNPEATAATRCVLLEARRKVGAHTLDRLERIKNLADPTDREVARRHIVQKNLQEITKLSCPGFVPASEGGSLCMHQHLIYCLLLMPICKGRCERFLPQREPGQEGGPNEEAS